MGLEDLHGGFRRGSGPCILSGVVRRGTRVGGRGVRVRPRMRDVAQEARLARAQAPVRVLGVDEHPVVEQADPLERLAANTRKARVEAIADALQALNRPALDAYRARYGTDTQGK